MKRIIISMTVLLGLVLLISAQCASNVNVDGNYEASYNLPKSTTHSLPMDLAGSIRLSIKRDGTSNTIKGTIEMSVKNFLSGFAKVADITGELKDEGGGIVLHTTVKPVSDAALAQTIVGKLDAKVKTTLGANAATTISSFLPVFKALYAPSSGDKLTLNVLENGSVLEDKEKSRKYKKK